MAENTSIEWCHDQTLGRRFWSKVEKGSDDACWHWRGATLVGGYGVITAAGRQTTAHRVSFWLAYGWMVDYLVCDHKCRNRSCVNPAHLQLITAAENVRIGLKGQLKTHCAHGHEFTVETTGITKQGRRFCLLCRRKRETGRHRDAEYWRNYRKARKEAASGV